MRRYACTLALLAACAPSRETKTSLPPTPERYCEATADMFCDFYLRCGRMAVADHASCVTVFLESCNGRYEPYYVALADAGLLTLSADGIAACASHLAEVRCEVQRHDLDGGCRGMWVGTVPAGGACGLGLESFVCDRASTCVLDLTLCGACYTAVGPGESCGGERRCAVGASCREGSCVATGEVGDACDADSPCATGLACDSGVCAGFSYVEVGDACDLDHRCPYKSACVGGECVETALQGEACSASAPCTTGPCEGGVCAPLRSVGEACASGVQCVAGTCDGRCGEVPGACVAP